MDTLSRDIARFAASAPQAWVWVLPLAGLPAGALPVFKAMLGDDERVRAATFHFSKDALAYAAAHALLRWCLSVRLRHAPRDWRFTADALGKPSLLAPAVGRDVRVSLSHTDGLVAVALAEGADIGVDAEAMKASSDLADIAGECFTASERDQLAQADCGFASDLERFYAFWTLKEALLKAKGLGLNQPPNTFSVDLRSMGADVPAALAPAQGWYLECRKATPGHLVAAALDAPRETGSVGFSVIGDAAAWVAALGRY